MEEGMSCLVPNKTDPNTVDDSEVAGSCKATKILLDNVEA
jgi:hypothetical protein